VNATRTAYYNERRGFAFLRRYLITPIEAKPTISIAQVEGSGTVGVSVPFI
jgi:hypothetical protein